jgi:hypothetical protein
MPAGTLHNQGTLLRCARIDAATAAESIDCSARTVHGWVPETAWHLAGLAACGALFFVWLHEDTGMLNRMEKQASNLLSVVPRGERVPSACREPCSSHGGR